MKRILFDVYELAPGTGKSMGVYNYARHLLRAMANSPRRDFEIVVACNPAALKDFSPPDELGRIKHAVRGNGVPRLTDKLLWIFGGAAYQCRASKTDIYFSPRGFLPHFLQVLAPQTRTLTTIHDLIRHWYHDNSPGYFSPLEDRFICMELLRSARKSHAVIAISRSTAIDIAARVPNASKLYTIYNGVDIAKEILPPPRTDPYLFAIASRYPHKNFDGLLSAYCEYRKQAETPMPLVVCGTGGSGKEPGVEYIKHLSDAELAAYYRNCQAFISLPFIEGFGFTPVEAWLCGANVICSDIPVLREVMGERASFVDLSNSQAIADCLLTDCTEHTHQAKNASERILPDEYSWNFCAERVLSVALGIQQ